MRNNKRKIAKLMIVVTILACFLFLFPKQLVLGGLRGGPIAPGQTADREDYTCIGIKLNFCPNWPDFVCTYFCSGIVTNKTCSIEKYDDGGMNRTPVACINP